MNGFLAGLIDRAEGRAPVLERRPRALFEPPRPAGLARGVEGLEQAEVRERPPASTMHDRADDPGPARLVAAPLAPIVVPERSAAPTLRQPPPLEERREKPAPRAAPAPAPPVPLPWRSVPSMATDEGAGGGRTVRRRPVAAPAVRVADPGAPGSPSPGALVPATSQAPPEAAGRVTSTTQPPRPVASVTRVAPHVQAAPSAPAVPVKAAPAAPRATVLLARAQAARPGRESSAAAVPPPIQITIGRVELRAVAAPAERRRANAPEAPRLSLDDYLRQRGGSAR